MIVEDSKKSLKVAKYNCELCGYITNNITDYNKHLSTAKHARITQDNEKSPNILVIFINCIIDKL